MQLPNWLQHIFGGISPALHTIFDWAYSIGKTTAVDLLADALPKAETIVQSVEASAVPGTQKFIDAGNQLKTLLESEGKSATQVLIDTAIQMAVAKIKTAAAP